MSTIVAISTAPTTGGIGIIRMSGENAFEIINKIFVPKNKDKKIEGYKIKYGNIVQNDTIIDEVLVSFFVNPKSYTTEDMCEINSHGGIVVMRKILDLCLKNGAELAEPGEFTKRAFLNGRIDLSQAEAVADIINAKSSKEAEVSMQQLNGYLSNEIDKIKKSALDILINIEALIDYPEYDVPEITNKEILANLDEIERNLSNLVKGFENGKIIKDGIKTVILGKPNAGKSSLLNLLAKEEKAIVTDIEGTTRDAIEEEITIDGIPFRIIDTAGIRETKNKVEKIGIDKAKKFAKESDLIVAIFDISQELSKEDREILDIIKNKKTLILLNKTDLGKKNDALIKELSKQGKRTIEISLLTGEGVDNIYKALTEMFNLNEISIENGAVVTNVRHKELIEKALNNAIEAKNTIKDNLPIDIISINIKNIIENLGEIIGENASEDLIKGIFAKFCLGK